MFLENTQYCPHVLTGRARSTPKAEYPKPFYRMVGVTDNPHTIDGQLVPIGGVYCVQAGQTPEIEYSPSDRSLSIDFTVVTTQLERTEGKRATRMAIEAESQPSADAVWGFDIPMIIPEDLWGWTLARLRLITGIWWRGDRDHFKANMRLTDILEHLTDTILAGDIQRDLPENSWLFAIERAASERIASLQSVEDLAFIAGMSKTHFSRLFTQVARQSPGMWLRERRLAAAAEMLRGTDLNIQQIAYRVGFIRASAMNQTWRREYNCTPSEWRNGKLGR